jgi:SSS family solute:Na+ symporter
MNNMSFMIWFSVYACAMITLGWYVSRKQKPAKTFTWRPFAADDPHSRFDGRHHGGDRLQRRRRRLWLQQRLGRDALRLGGAVGILLVAWLFAPVRKLRFMTMSEEMSYYTGGSKIIKNLVAILIFIASIGWLGAHILGGGLYLAWASGIDINVAKIIIALAFVVYVGIGGYSGSMDRYHSIDRAVRRLYFNGDSGGSSLAAGAIFSRPSIRRRKPVRGR